MATSRISIIAGYFSNVTPTIKEGSLYVTIYFRSLYYSNSSILYFNFSSKKLILDEFQCFTISTNYTTPLITSILISNILLIFDHISYTSFLLLSSFFKFLRGFPLRNKWNLERIC